MSDGVIIALLVSTVVVLLIIVFLIALGYYLVFRKRAESEEAKKERAMKKLQHDDYEDFKRRTTPDPPPDITVSEWGSPSQRKYGSTGYQSKPMSRVAETYASQDSKLFNDDMTSVSLATKPTKNSNGVHSKTSVKDSIKEEHSNRGAKNAPSEKAATNDTGPQPLREEEKAETKRTSTAVGSEEERITIEKVPAKSSEAATSETSSVHLTIQK